MTTATRDPRHTTDLPTQQSPRASVNLAAIAQRYALPIRAAYLVCIAIATLLHLGFDGTLANALYRLQRAVEPNIGFKDIVDGVRNIALFLGWGAVWVLTSRPQSSRRDVIAATAVGMLASITVESAQLFSPFRMASVIDVATNTIGSLLGAFSVWAIERRMSADVRGGTLIGVPAWLPGGALLITAFGLTFAPSSRPTMAIAWGSPLNRAYMVEAAEAIAVNWPALITDVVAWLCVGLTLAVAVADRTGRVRFGQLAAWIGIVATTLTAAHLGRSLAGLQREAGAWQIHAAAVTLGLLTGLVLVPSWRGWVTARSERALQLGLLALLLGAVMSWSPATWALTTANTPSISWRQLVPMMSLFQRQDLSSVFLVLQKAGIGAAIGACLAARKRVGVPRPGLRAAIGIATLFEVGQAVIPGRYPDVTDIMITSAAAGLVAVLVERSHRSTFAEAS